MQARRSFGNVSYNSTFSVNRHGRFRDSDVFRQFFEAVVKACMDAGLVKGEGFAVDASVMEADASRYHGEAPDEIDWSAPERQTRAVAEFLSGLDDQDPNPDREPPKMISPTDPCSAWTAKANKRVQFGYGLNYLINIENAVIVDVEATPARTSDEVAATKTMIERTKQRLNLTPNRLAADTAYGTGCLAGLSAQASRRTSRYGRRVNVMTVRSRAATSCSTRRRTSIGARTARCCGQPAGWPHDPVSGEQVRLRSLPLEAKVLPERRLAQGPRAAGHARALMGTPEFEKSRDERKRVEMRFAHLKTHHRFERMRLRGLTGARDEFHLGAIAQNLKTLANHLWRPRPNEPAACMT